MVQYHFKIDDGPDLGPVSAEEFQVRLEAGDIKDETMVWRSGMIEWATYASLRASDQQSALARTTKPARSPVKAAAPAVAPRGDQIPCGSCGLEWPQNLLTLEDGRQICGNCVNRKKKEMKDGRKVRPIGGGKATACIILAIVCAGCLYYKVSHYGIGPPMKAKELSEPAKYGR